MKYFSFWSTGIRVRWNIWEGYIIAATIRPIFKLTKPSVASLTICTSFFIRRIEIMNTCSYILIDFLCVKWYIQCIYWFIHIYLVKRVIYWFYHWLYWYQMLILWRCWHQWNISIYLLLMTTCLWSVLFFIVAVWLVFHEVILNKLSNQLINFWIFSYK